MVVLAVVNVMDGQTIAKSVFRCATKLTAKAIAFAYLLLDPSTKSRRVFRCRNAACPHRVTLTADQYPNHRAPFRISRKGSTSASCLFATIVGPSGCNFASSIRSLTTLKPRLWLSHCDRAHVRALLWRALVRHRAVAAHNGHSRFWFPARRARHFLEGHGA